MAEPFSFVAPELPAMGPRYPAWILLARHSFISDRQNSTVAHGHTSDGSPIEVSLFAAEPPAVSHLRVHCPGRNHKLSYNPAVLCSRDDLVLLDVFFHRSKFSDCFIYRAHPKEPSLVLLEKPEPTNTCSFQNMGLVRFGDDDDGFVVAALFWDHMSDKFKLAVYSSVEQVWKIKVVKESWSSLKPELLMSFQSTKVIPLRDSLLGWVDVWRGILICDVFASEPELLYVPMPEPMPGNVSFEDEGEPAFFRDVIGCGEVIKFIEMDYYEKDDEDDDPTIYGPDDKWIAATGSRKLDTTRGWGEVHEFSSEEVMASQDFDGGLDLLPEELCEDGKPSLKRIPVGLPTLCEFNSLVYMMCKLRFGDITGWVLAVDTESKKLVSVAKFSAVRFPAYMTAYCPSSFSKYFNDNSQ